MEKLYTIYDFGDDVPHWNVVPKITIDEFPWYESGKKQLTFVQCVISRNTLQLRIESEDIYIRSEAKELNEPVYNDSCFEFFLTPNGVKGSPYFNIEVNCIGTLYMAYKDNTPSRVLVTEGQASKIQITSKMIKDEGWSLDISLPIEILEEMCGYKIEKQMWHGNFYRCGGIEDAQYACWNKIESEYPNYHLPKTFGTLAVSKRVKQSI